MRVKHIKSGTSCTQSVPLTQKYYFKFKTDSKLHISASSYKQQQLSKAEIVKQFQS